MPRLTTPDLDLSQLHELAVEQPKMTKQASSGRLKLADNSARFTKIAFDLFRDSESEFVWKLEKDSDTGEEFIIRTASVDPLYKASQEWSAAVNTNNTAITLVYRGHAIKAFKKSASADDGGIPLTEDNSEDWRRFLVDKISSDPTFLNKVLSQVGDSRKKYILGKFPELGK